MYPDCDTYEPLYPAQDTLRHILITLIKVAWQMVGNELPISISWMNTTQLNNTNMKVQAKIKSNDFQSYPRRETAAGGGKRCR